jgi:hypothetical protein
MDRSFGHHPRDGRFPIWLQRFRRSAFLDSLNQDFFLASIAVSVLVPIGIGAHFH